MKSINTICLLCFLTFLTLEKNTKAQMLATTETLDVKNISTPSILIPAQGYTLTSFNVRCIEGQVYANWVVIEPTTDCLYLLERSCDNKHYEVLFSKQGTISPNNIALLHSFVDKFPLSGVSYYRMRRFSKEGCIASETIQICNDKTLKQNLAGFISVASKRSY